MSGQINKFTGQYRFLSNFYPSIVVYNGCSFSTVEHAYQAAKCKNPQDRAWIATLETPGEAKRAGRTVELVDNWEDIKLLIIDDLVSQKFRDRDLSIKLIETDPLELIEGNYWHDRFYGQCYCNIHLGAGRNELGKILMKIRSNLIYKIICTKCNSIVNTASKDNIDIYENSITCSIKHDCKIS